MHSLLKITTVIVALCALLSKSANAIVLTLINPEDQAAVPALNENVNQDQAWVVGGSSSAIDYGATQRSAVVTIEAGPGGNGNFGSFLGTDDSNDPGTVEQGHNTAENTNGANGQSEVQNGITLDANLFEVGITSLVSGTNTPTNPNGTAFTNNEVVAGDYFTLGFDMNPINSFANPHITFSQIQVWTSPTAITSQFETGPADPNFDLGTLVWDLDANNTDNSITLHKSNNGSGVTDMLIYISVEDFIESVAADTGAQVTSDYFLYVWIELETYGETNANQFGFISGDADSTYIPPGNFIPVPELNQSVLIVSILALTATVRRRKRYYL